MTFDWHGFAQLAEDLATCEDEAAARSAISRAYYALYCQARDRAGIDTRNIRDAHKAVHDYYAFRQNPKLKLMGTNDLPNLHRERKYADYDETQIVGKSRASMVVKKARALLSALAGLSDEQLRK